VQLAPGHSTPMITLNTYAGEWPDTDYHARMIVDSALGDVPVRALPSVPSGKSPSQRLGLAVFQR